MLMKDLVASIETEIKQLPKDYESEFFIQLESELAVYELKYMLKVYKENLNSEAQVDAVEAAGFLSFLNIRWLRIKNTDAVYPHHHMSPANQICVSLAKMLGEALSVSPAKLIMLDLEATEISIGLGFPEDLTLHLHRFVLSDDNTRPIDILKANLELKHTASFKGKPEDLSETEKSRVTRHSALTEELNVKVIAIKEEGLKEEGFKEQKTATRKKKVNLRSHLAKVNTQECKSSYGETGRLLLLDNVCNSLKALLPPRKLPLDAMANHEQYVGDEEHAKAAFLPYLMNQLVELYNRPKEFTGLFGSFSGYGKQDKFEGIKFIYQFMQSAKPLSELKTLVDLPINQKYKNTLTQSFSASKMIYDQALKIADPVYRSALVPLRPSSWW